MAKLIDDINSKDKEHIPLHYLSATKSIPSRIEMVSFFALDTYKINRIGTDYKLFCNFNKPLCKYKL
jgi:hypothetical protein